MPNITVWVWVENKQTNEKQEIAAFHQKSDQRQEEEFYFGGKLARKWGKGLLPG